MTVFDLQLPDRELEDALGRTYQVKLKVLKSTFREHRTEVTRRLGMLTVIVDMAEGAKSIEILVKEGSKYELLITSLANKLFPYNSPKIIWSMLSGTGAWLLLENINTWVDVCGRQRVNETLIDGLYEIHQVTFIQTELLLNCFDIPILTGEAIYRRAITAYEGIQQIWDDILFKEVFTSGVRTLLLEVKESLVEIKSVTFPYVLTHSNFTHNTVRAILDDMREYHVVAYDWVNSAIGWPQTDLVLLLDRVQFVAFYQSLPDPSPVLLDRYLEHLLGDYKVDVEVFRKVFRLCSICNTLAVMRWWLYMHKSAPSRDPERAFAEIRAKLNILHSVQ